MADRTYVFRLTGDFSQLESASAAAGGAVDGLTGKTEGFAQAQARADRAADKTAKTLRGFSATGKITAQELTQVGFQVQDFAVQVASGQNAIVALVQQGSQLSGTFGGVGNAARALVSLLTPMRVIVGGVAAGFGAVALAAAQGYREQAQFERSLLLTGNRAGITAQQFQDLARRIADSTSATIAGSKQALQAVVSTGAFGPKEIEEVTRAVVLFADRSDQSAEQVAKDFARMGEGAARFAAERNKSLNFLTAAQFRYIRQLEAEGKAEQARIEVAKLLSEQLGRKTPTELGYLETSLKAVKKAASDFWDALLDIGRPATLEQKLNDAIELALAAQKRLEEVEGQRFKFKGDVENRRAIFDAAKARVDALRQQRDAERQAAQQAATDAAKNQREIEESSREFANASIGRDQSLIALRQAMGDAARARELEAVERQYRNLQIGERAFIDARVALEERGVKAKIAAVEQEIALEKRRVIEGSQAEIRDQQMQREAAINGLLARKVALTSELASVRAKADVERSEYAQRELQEEGQFLLALLQRRGAQTLPSGEYVPAAAVREIQERNRDLNIALIRDDQARGQAQIAIEAKVMRERIDIAALSDEQKRAIEDGFANYVVLRNRQLTEELKPEWQRLVEGWRDTGKLLQETTDRFQLDFLRTSEDVFVKFVRDRKFDIKSLLDLILETEARLIFQRSFGQQAGGLASFIGSLIGGGSSSSPTGGSGITLDGVNAGGGSGGTYSLGTKLATGTNFVPYDGFPALLHEGEAVVPKAYNPAAGGGGGNVTVNVIGGEKPQKVEQRRDANGNLSIDLIYDQFERRLNERTAAGYGVAPGVQRRLGGSGAVNLPR